MAKGFSFELSDPDGKRHTVLSEFKSPLIVQIHFFDIVRLLIANGFKTYMNGMHRKATGCCFPWEGLTQYKSVVDFQLEWGFTYPE